MSMLRIRNLMVNRMDSVCRSARAALLEILQDLPLGSERIEEGWADGGGGAPDQDAHVLAEQRRSKEEDQEPEELRETIDSLNKKRRR